MKIRHTRVGTLRLAAPWGLAVSGFELPAVYGLVDGHPCWIRLTDGNTLELKSGDVILVRGAHQLLHKLDSTVTDMREVLREHGYQRIGPDDEPNAPIHMRWGGSGAFTHLIGLAFDPIGGAKNPLLNSLPQHIFLRGEHKQFPWINAAMDFLTAESAGSAGYAAMARLFSELVFISILRFHLQDESATTKGWLKGLTDPAIARVLQAIHEKPGEPWAVHTLAQLANMSRTSFAVRFASLVEVTPIEYLTQWRMHLAAERIVSSHPNLTQLAFELGYSSDAAFRQTFKARYGVPPSRFANPTTATASPED